MTRPASLVIVFIFLPLTVAVRAGWGDPGRLICRSGRCRRRDRHVLPLAGEAGVLGPRRGPRRSGRHGRGRRAERRKRQPDAAVYGSLLGRRRPPHPTWIVRVLACHRPGELACLLVGGQSEQVFVADAARGVSDDDRLGRDPGHQDHARLARYRERSLRRSDGRAEPVRARPAGSRSCALSRPRGRRIAADIDHYKRINDAHGHETGDTVLREVAHALRSNLRSFPLLYRTAEEQFIAMLPGLGCSEGERIAERLRTAAARLAGAGSR